MRTSAGFLLLLLNKTCAAHGFGVLACCYSVLAVYVTAIVLQYNYKRIKCGDLAVDVKFRGFTGTSVSLVLPARLLVTVPLW